jgi:hypothetical protein
MTQPAIPKRTARGLRSIKPAVQIDHITIDHKTIDQQIRGNIRDSLYTLRDLSLNGKFFLLTD